MKRIVYVALTAITCYHAFGSLSLVKVIAAVLLMTCGAIVGWNAQNVKGLR